jgi:CRISPR-associated protein Cmr2
LRDAEKRAKNEGGRDAFSITVIKRSGGALRLTERWGEPVNLLNDLIAFLRDEGTSRRAVYNSLEWLTDLPWPGGEPEMLESLLAYQLARQTQDKVLKEQEAPKMAGNLAALTVEQERERFQRLKDKMPIPKAQQQAGGEAMNWLHNFLTVAEFLARETRSGGDV